MRLLDKYYWKFVWIMFGFLFAVAGSLMLVSGTFQVDAFYDVGKVYDVSQSELAANWNDTMHYDNIKQVWVVDTDVAAKNVGLSDLKGGWNYSYISLSEISEDSLDARLDFYDSNSVLTGQMYMTLSEGDNVFENPSNDFSRMDIVIENQTGLSFRIDDVQLRESKPIFSMEKFKTYLILLWIGFLLVTGIVCRCLRGKFGNISWYTPIHGIQKIFLYVGENGEKLSRKYSQKQRGWMRSGLFCFLFLFVQISFISDYYNSDEGFKYLLLLCVGLFVLMALLCWEKPLHHLDWNNKLVLSWLLLWVTGIISDFVVIKRYTGMGFFMIFVMGFLFFMWGNMKHREWMIRDFLRGIRWSFLPNILFCWIFRPYIPGYRYMGSSYSPGIFALYILFVWLAFMAELDFDFSNKKSFAKNGVYVLALGICGDFLWKTQAISSILPAVLAVIIFSLKLWINRRKLRLWAIPMWVLIFALGFAIDSYCVFHIPRTLNTEIKFEKDFYMDVVTEHPFTITVQAAEEGNENRLLYKLKTSTSLETLTSGRTLYWKGYLRELNLWGHRNKAYILGGYRMPHNGFIAVMYRYGIFAAVPYILMVVYNLIYAVRYFWRHMYDSKKYAFFVLADMFCCALLLLVENLELPLGWLCWYGLYFVMGVYFDDEKTIESE